MTITVQSQLQRDLTHAALRWTRARAHARQRDSAADREMVDACMAHLDRLLDMWTTDH